MSKVPESADGSTRTAAIKTPNTRPDPGALALRYIPAAELVPYAKNARTHSEAQLEAIRKSMREFGWTSPVLLDGDKGMIAGHGRLLAAQEMWAAGEAIKRTTGPGMVPCINLEGLTPAQKRAYVIADNQLALRAGWDEELLKAEIGQLKLEGFELGVLGFKLPDLNRMLKGGPEGGNEIPALEQEAVSRVGDVWQLGRHRIMCGDTTDPQAVSQLLAGARPVLIHADPPYGMGKEADGVANDNLYRDKLDAFQLLWWHTWSGCTTDNASAYIWGNPEDLWRLWWRAGLADEPGLMVRNEIVWDKGGGFGITGESAHSYVVSTERCLFLMRGQQFLGNQNKADYWEGYEPLRLWLVGQLEAAGWVKSDANRITDTQMAGHWFSQSQFFPIAREHYQALQAAAAGRAFVEDYDHLFDRLFPGARAGGNQRRRELAAELRERRSYFDNTHEAMTEVWAFPRVSGEDRHGHATPKPVEIVERAVKTSTKEGDIVGVPFAGTCPEVIACERTGRVCLAMEIEPAYVDVVVRRWQEFTGQVATLEGVESFEEVALERAQRERIAA